MRIATSSNSAAVTRTLAQIITLSGHSVAADAARAELILIDGAHGGEALAEDTPQLVLEAAAPIAPHALIQRLSGWQMTQALPLGAGWVLDPLARRLQHESGAHATLTEKECAVLRQLRLARAHTLTREALLEAVWGVDEQIDTHTLETHIYRLRSKLETLTPSPADIITDSGAYRLLTKG